MHLASCGRPQWALVGTLLLLKPLLYAPLLLAHQLAQAQDWSLLGWSLPGWSLPGWFYLGWMLQACPLRFGLSLQSDGALSTVLF